MQLLISCCSLMLATKLEAVSFLKKFTLPKLLYIYLALLCKRCNLETCVLKTTLPCSRDKLKGLLREEVPGSTTSCVIDTGLLPCFVLLHFYGERTGSSSRGLQKSGIPLSRHLWMYYRQLWRVQGSCSMVKGMKTLLVITQRFW